MEAFTAKSFFNLVHESKVIGIVFGMGSIIILKTHRKASLFLTTKTLTANNKVFYLKAFV